jgi:hypothetical protein
MRAAMPYVVALILIAALFFPDFHTDFKADSVALADFIAFAQGRDVEENVNATIVRFNETKTSIAIEHLNFSGWHAIPQFYDRLLAVIRRRATPPSAPAGRPGRLRRAPTWSGKVPYDTPGRRAWVPHPNL